MLNFNIYNKINSKKLATLSNFFHACFYVLHRGKSRNSGRGGSRNRKTAYYIISFLLSLVVNNLRGRASPKVSTSSDTTLPPPPPPPPPKKKEGIGHFHPPSLNEIRIDLHFTFVHSCAVGGGGSEKEQSTLVYLPQYHTYLLERWSMQNMLGPLGFVTWWVLYSS